jgi:lysozyme
MVTSPEGIALIKEFEGFREDAYPDAAGIITIGWGTTRIYGRKVKLGMKINEPVGDLLLAGDLQDAEDEVTSLVRFPIKQCQFDALVSFEYNTGELSNSTLIKIINSQSPLVTEDLFTRWNKTMLNGKLVPLDGLTRRRKAEYALYVKDTKNPIRGL